MRAIDRRIKALETKISSKGQNYAVVYREDGESTADAIKKAGVEECENVWVVVHVSPGEVCEP